MRTRTFVVQLVGVLALTVSCTSTQDFFQDPPHLAGRSSAGSGFGASGGRGGASGSGGSSAGGSDGGSSAGNQGGRGGGAGEQGAAAGTLAAGSGTSGSAGTGGSSAGTGSFISGGQAGTVGSGGLEAGAAGETGAGGEAATGGTSGVGGSAGTGGASGGGGTSGGGSGGTGGAACSPKPEVCDGVSNDCDDAIDEDDACPVGCHAQERDGHLYLLCMHPDADEQLDYDEASVYCQNVGSSLELGIEFALADVELKPENDFLKEWIASAAGSTAGMVWMGANDLDQERQWVWGRGSGAEQFFTANRMGGGMPYMMRFNDFAADRPNGVNGDDEDCGSFDSEFDWQWNDLVCSVERLGFVCEQTP